jgi:hypothetical protein
MFAVFVESASSSVFTIVSAAHRIPSHKTVIFLVIAVGTSESHMLSIVNVAYQRLIAVSALSDASSLFFVFLYELLRQNRKMMIHW